MIQKFLLIIAVIAIVYFIFSKKKPLSKKSKDSIEESNDMVGCHSCNTYSTIEDSILSNGKYFCSKECLEKLK